jgi:hypothetical protein
VEIKSFFFNTLYHGTVVLDYPHFLGSHDFLLSLFFFSFFFFLILTRCFSCILLMYLDCPFAPFSDFFADKLQKC